ncbi:MAG: acetate--CoA ligase family protein [Theionarchaea archaeon]|nr:acetate--CoA ligase family protein [Theionarchaea archaeon]MBU7001840.1 acetate--CoA ligase family protein [Theionarchaea archaeon]MBU7020943.1 acetate--CoA ligase family protein [Theionarchaea archaeon]MBU7033997.1 acetate--CoA ligase family protein [Theionarchaea archaeon]MBU7041050.1 acetate--CoA ligase family protein [Theionarchaea archaeon]
MHPLIEKGMNEKRSLLEPEAKTLLREYNLPVPEFQICSTPEEAAAAAERLTYPMVMKVVSPDISHKTDIGGVRVGLQSREDMKAAFKEIKEAAQSHGTFAGVIVYHMQDQGTEIIIGVTYDTQFEHALMFGLGGIFVEVLRDISFRLIPITEHDAWEMVHEIKGYPVLTGVRGQLPRDIEAVVDALLKVSLLVEENPQIHELDLNPVFVYDKGISIIDARIVM